MKFTIRSELFLMDSDLAPGSSVAMTIAPFLRKVSMYVLPNNPPEPVIKIILFSTNDLTDTFLSLTIQQFSNQTQYQCQCIFHRA